MFSFQLLILTCMIEAHWKQRDKVVTNCTSVCLLDGDIHLLKELFIHIFLSKNINLLIFHIYKHPVKSWTLKRKRLRYSTEQSIKNAYFWLRFIKVTLSRVDRSVLPKIFQVFALWEICLRHRIIELFNINIYKGILLLIKERELESSEITTLFFHNTYIYCHHNSAIVIKLESDGIQRHVQVLEMDT